MSFLVRQAYESDLEDIFALSKQFVLLNLPSDKKKIISKIELSLESFAGNVVREKARYMFVLEDLEQKRVVGSSQIVGKKGTPENPNISFKIIKKERFSPDLSVGFIHQLLRLNLNTDGPSEVGGLVVDRAYRRRPEKVGRLLSLARFKYIGSNKSKFESKILSEMAPPLTDEGRSEFWEALGRRFTGMPYKEADALSGQNKEFIKSLFPEEDIYTCLLDSRARLVMGQVSDETRPALHLLKKIGFEFNNEVDPFDGGPHVEASVDEITIIKNALSHEINLENHGAKFEKRGLVSVSQPKDFIVYSSFDIIDDRVVLPPHAIKSLKLHGEKTDDSAR
ncbi:MAG: arginine N-succinyltransferase [Bdellovibrionales bacterium]